MNGVRHKGFHRIVDGVVAAYGKLSRFHFHRAEVEALVLCAVLSRDLEGELVILSVQHLSALRAFRKLKLSLRDLGHIILGFTIRADFTLLADVCRCGIVENLHAVRVMGFLFGGVITALHLTFLPMSGFVGRIFQNVLSVCVVLLSEFLFELRIFHADTGHTEELAVCAAAIFAEAAVVAKLSAFADCAFVAFRAEDTFVFAMIAVLFATRHVFIALAALRAMRFHVVPAGFAIMTFFAEFLAGCFDTLATVVAKRVKFFAAVFAVVAALPATGYIVITLTAIRAMKLIIIPAVLAISAGLAKLDLLAEGAFAALRADVRIVAILAMVLAFRTSVQRLVIEALNDYALAFGTNAVRIGIFLKAILANISGIHHRYAGITFIANLTIFAFIRIEEAGLATVRTVNLFL